MAPRNAHFAASRVKKRKQRSDEPEAPAPVLNDARDPVLARPKKSKPLGALRWRSVQLPAEVAFGDDGGLLELEEVDGVDVVYGDTGITFQTVDDEEVQDDAEAHQQPEIDWSAFKTEDQVLEEEEQPGQDTAMDLEPETSSPLDPEQAAKPVKTKAKGKQPEVKPVEAQTVPEPVAIAEDDEDVLPTWSHLPLSTPLRRALAELGFTKPTEIQERVLKVEKTSSQNDDLSVGGDTSAPGGSDDVSDPIPSTSSEPYVSPFPEEELSIPEETTQERDIVGVAQTGSGKTLAYGLPILSWILAQQEHTGEGKRQPAALILAPTRELALQVRTAIADVAYRTNPPAPGEPAPTRDAAGKRVRGRLVNVVALTGGMSIEKQKRQISKGADVIVATPGRLWDLIGDNDDLAKMIKGIKFLVIDEADRMIENGHFAELDNIVKLTRRQTNTIDAEFEDDFKLSSGTALDRFDARPDMRTFVFSATMSKDMQRNLKKRSRYIEPGETTDDMSSLDDLLAKLDFRDEDPEIIDLSPKGAVVDTLKECKVECLLPEKDIHLYHFLLRYPGRTIVFLSAIDGIRRLFPLLSLLEFNVQQLHSGMQQRARLKSLDRFKSAQNAVLLATDVAARGLDIPSVHHVVHFQLPRSADTYVHRSGRTARAGEEGLALQLVAPDEKKTQRLLMSSLGKKTDLPVLPVDYSILDQLKARVELAKKIEQAEHKLAKLAHDETWLQKTAEAVGMDLDDSVVGGGGGGGGGGDSDDDHGQGGKVLYGSKKERKRQSGMIKALKAELKDALSRPVMVRGISSKYITGRNRVGFVDQLVGGTSHSSIYGVQASTALDDLPKPKKQKTSV